MKLESKTTKKNASGNPNFLEKLKLSLGITFSQPIFFFFFSYE